MDNKERYEHLVKALLAFTAGVLFILFPGYISGVVGLVIGIVLIIRGLTDLIAYLTVERYRFGGKVILTTGIAAMLLGLFFIVFPGSFMQILAIIVGIYFLISGLSKYTASLMLTGGGIIKYFGMIMALIEMAIGLIIIIRPFSGVEAIIILCGIGWIIGGVRSLGIFLDKGDREELFGGRR